MNKKYQIIGITVTILIFAMFIYSMFTYFNSGVGCWDGQGSTIYVTKDDLLANLNSIGPSEIQTYYVPSNISFVAETSTNPCGKTVTRIIVKNGNEERVSQKNFDKFIADYNSGCGDCLFILFHSGNSPLFINEYSSGKSYTVENNNGTLILKQSENP
jgi:hypothetical protein